MIKYALRCGGGCEFEGWFRDSADYDAQREAAALACPACGSPDVGKQVMAPAVARSGSLSERGSARERLAAYKRDLNDAARRARDHVERNFEHVGERFPEEARRIHYGEAEPRAIYGEATLKDAVALAEEGVAVAPVPKPTDEPPVVRKKLS